jgi:hypothetical protein
MGLSTHIYERSGFHPRMDHITPTSGLMDSAQRKMARIGRSFTSDSPLDRDSACIRALPQKLKAKYGGWVVSTDHWYGVINLSNRAVDGTIQVTCFIDGNDKADTDIKAKCGADVVGSSTGTGYKSLNDFDTDVYARIDKLIPEVVKYHALRVKDPATGKIKRSVLRKATDGMKVAASGAAIGTAVVVSAATMFAVPMVIGAAHHGATKVGHAAFRR